MRDRITSPSNPQVRYVMALHRRRVRHRERRFLAEGFRLIEEGLRAKVRPISFYYTDAAAACERGWALLKTAQELGVTPTQVDPTLMSAMADTETPQGVLAIFPFLEPSPPPRSTLTLVMDRLRDPGNLGTLLRSADAAGVDEVLLTPWTVDIYNPKVVRAGMGSHFRLPFRMNLGWEEIRRAVAGMKVALADAHGEVNHYDIPWQDPWAIIIGGEAEGARNEARALAQCLVQIPCREGVESLNAAVAGSVILFEARRQRHMRAVP